MSAKATINFDALQKGSGQDFYEQLENVPRNLNDENLRKFFEEILELFERTDLSRLVKHDILSTLIKSLSSQSHLESFCTWNFPERLPFKQFFLQEQILDLVYIIATYYPAGINRDTARLFGHLIGRFTRKCLMILSVFAERFQIVLNPWPVTDLLYRYCDYFSSPGCVNDYISTLVYLNRTFQDYREARQQHTWDALCVIIEKTNLNSVKANCYFAMCHLYELNPIIVSSYKFPNDAPQHLCVEELQYPVISLLMRVPPNGVVLPVLKALVQISEKNTAAGYAIAKLAENRSSALVLSRDVFWIAEDLPTMNDTIKIFAKLLNFIPARRELMAHEEVAKFLNKIASSGDALSLVATSAFVRRMPIDTRFIGLLSKGGFLATFFNNALPQKDKDVQKATILLIEAIATKADAVELATVCDYVSTRVQKNDNDACRAAVKLAQYPRCAKEFKENNLNDYFANNDSKHSKAFLDNYKKSVDRPITAPAGGSPRRTPAKKAIDNIDSNKVAPKAAQPNDTPKKEAPTPKKQPEPTPEPKKKPEATTPTAEKSPKNKKESSSSSTSSDNDDNNSPPSSPRNSLQGSALPRPTNGNNNALLPGSLVGADVLNTPPPPSSRKSRE